MRFLPINCEFPVFEAQYKRSSFRHLAALRSGDEPIAGTMPLGTNIRLAIAASDTPKPILWKQRA